MVNVEYWFKLVFMFIFLYKVLNKKIEFIIPK